MRKPQYSLNEKDEERFNFLLEVKKIFPNATIESINIGKILYKIDFCWCYGEVSINNYPDEYHKQILLINDLARRLVSQTKDLNSSGISK